MPYFDVFAKTLFIEALDIRNKLESWTYNEIYETYLLILLLLCHITLVLLYVCRFWETMNFNDSETTLRN